MVTKIRSRSRKVKEASDIRVPLSNDERNRLRQFVYYCLGDGHLSVWEENFLNTIKGLLYSPVIFISPKQAVIIQQLKEKLHFDRPDEPLPVIDPDGIVENDDPDGYIIRQEERIDDPMTIQTLLYEDPDGY